MLTYSEVIELRDKLAKGEIAVVLAKEQYWNDYKAGQRSWETKDWKERKAQFIKDKCEVCNGNDTLTIQHRSHPKKYSEYLRCVTKTYTDEYIAANPAVEKAGFRNYILECYNYVPVPLCPDCKRSSLKERKTLIPKFRCPVCHHEFDDTVIKSVDELISIFHENEDAIEVRDKCFLSKDQWRNKHNLSDIRYWMQRKQGKK